MHKPDKRLEDTASRAVARSTTNVIIAMIAGIMQKKCLKLTDKQKDHVGADFCDIEEAANEIGLDLGPGEEGTDFFNIMEGEDSKDQVT